MAFVKEVVASNGVRVLFFDDYIVRDPEQRRLLEEHQRKLINEVYQAKARREYELAQQSAHDSLVDSSVIQDDP